MSTILKALRRLEEDKSGTRERPLREEILVAHRERRRGVGIALGCALLVVGVGLGLLWGRPLLAPTEGEETPSAAEAPGAANASSLALAPEARSSRAAAASVAPAPESSSPAKASPSAAGGSKPTNSPPPAVQPAAEPSSAPRARDAAAPASPPPSESASVARAARAPRLPPIVVTRTVWHPEPGRREAVVELEGRAEPLRLREGDAVGTLVVGEIEPSGVLFLRDGVEIHARVGGR